MDGLQDGTDHQSGVAFTVTQAPTATVSALLEVDYTPTGARASSQSLALGNLVVGKRNVLLASNYVPRDYAGNQFGTVGPVILCVAPLPAPAPAPAPAVAQPLH